MATKFVEDNTNAEGKELLKFISTSPLLTSLLYDLDLLPEQIQRAEDLRKMILIAAHFRRAVSVGVSTRKAIDDITAERSRQVIVEGWTPAHDDEHRDGSLAKAASCYAFIAGASEAERAAFAWSPTYWWPRSWDQSWWKPKDRRQDLVRAGALVVAEIERLDRRG